MVGFKWTPRSKMARSGGPAWRREGRGVFGAIDPIKPNAPPRTQDISPPVSRSVNPGSTYASGPSANDSVARSSIAPSAPLRANPLGTGSPGSKI